MFASIATLLVAMLSIQGGASLAKGLFPVVGASGATTLRICLAAIGLLLIWRPFRGKIAKKDWFSLFIYGAALGAMNLTFYLALERIPLGIAVALEFTGPLAVAIFFSRRSIDFVWAFFAAVGIALILPITPASSSIDPIGASFALFAGACWALYIVFGRKAGGAMHGVTATSIGMAFAAIVTLPFGVADAGTRLLDSRILPLALAVAFLSSALPYSLEMIALKKLPAKTFGILMSLEPCVAAIVGGLMLGETLSLLQMGAIGCIIVASTGTAVSARGGGPVPAPAGVVVE